MFAHLKRAACVLSLFLLPACGVAPTEQVAGAPAPTMGKSTSNLFPPIFTTTAVREGCVYTLTLDNNYENGQRPGDFFLHLTRGGSPSECAWDPQRILIEDSQGGIELVNMISNDEQGLVITYVRKNICFCPYGPSSQLVVLRLWPTTFELLRRDTRQMRNQGAGYFLSATPSFTGDDLVISGLKVGQLDSNPGYESRYTVVYPDFWDFPDVPPTVYSFR